MAAAVHPVGEVRAAEGPGAALLAGEHARLPALALPDHVERLVARVDLDAQRPALLLWERRGRGRRAPRRLARPLGGHEGARRRALRGLRRGGRVGLRARRGGGRRRGRARGGGLRPRGDPVERVRQRVPVGRLHGRAEGVGGERVEAPGGHGGVEHGLSLLLLVVVSLLSLLLSLSSLLILLLVVVLSLLVSLLLLLLFVLVLLVLLLLLLLLLVVVLLLSLLLVVLLLLLLLSSLLPGLLKAHRPGPALRAPPRYIYISLSLSIYIYICIYTHT